MTRKYIQVTESKKVEIHEEEFNIEQIGDEEIAGKTLCSMISAGTETNAGYIRGNSRLGYMVVFQVEKIGKNVQGFSVGDMAYAEVRHQSHQRVNYKNAIKIPQNLKPEEALFARMMVVSMATIEYTHIPVGETILVTGLGTVGLMAMQVYSNLGYHVIGTDPIADRRNVASSLGFEVYESVPLDNANYMGKIGLALECSGNEAATLDCCKIVRKYGEVSLVGVPWKKCCDMTAFEILNKIFYNVVKVYSGWERFLPEEARARHYKMAMEMLVSGKVKVDGLYEIKSYTQAQESYDAIYNKTTKKLSTIFHW